MKSAGYVRCALCGELTRGYKPRHWEFEDQLHVWAHGPEGAYKPGRLKCDGSYKAGVDTHLDERLAQEK